MRGARKYTTLHKVRHLISHQEGQETCKSIDEGLLSLLWSAHHLCPLVAAKRTVRVHIFISHTCMRHWALLLSTKLREPNGLAIHCMPINKMTRQCTAMSIINYEACCGSEGKGEVETVRVNVLPLSLDSAHSTRDTAYGTNNMRTWQSHAQVSALISPLLGKELFHMRRLPIRVRHSSTHLTCWRNSTGRENTYMQWLLQLAVSQQCIFILLLLFFFPPHTRLPPHPPTHLHHH